MPRRSWRICWAANLGPEPKKPWYDGHQQMEQGLVRFGRFVNDMEGGGKGQKYIDLAKFLLDCRYTAAVNPERTGRSTTRAICLWFSNTRWLGMPCARSIHTRGWRMLQWRHTTPIIRARSNRSGTTWSTRSITSPAE